MPSGHHSGLLHWLDDIRINACNPVTHLHSCILCSMAGWWMV
jgi:hypothetical protein